MFEDGPHPPPQYHAATVRLDQVIAREEGDHSRGQMIVFGFRFWSDDHGKYWEVHQMMPRGCGPREVRAILRHIEGLLQQEFPGE